MRVQRLRIDGFGHFADTEWGAFERPVTVFHGPNEAGKSTLLQFVRQVLFGFPGTRNSKHYPAFAGGRYGGNVTIVSDSGETVIVQRTVGRSRLLLQKASRYPIANCSGSSAIRRTSSGK